ncbi:hypothetical protein PTKIN_Ptkin03bG0045300 [Pterospermum kingtungense]
MKEKRAVLDFKPFEPIYAALYQCDTRFHIKALNKCLELDDDKFGFIMMDDNETFFDMLCGRPNVSRLILAGSGDFKIELCQLDMFDQQLQSKILNVVDVSWKYFKKMREDTWKGVSGMDDTLKTMEMGAIEIEIVCEDLDITGYVLKNNITDKVAVKYLNKEQEADMSNFHDSASSADI